MIEVVKSASVGSQFDFVGKHTLKELPALFDMQPSDCQPADYSHELTYHDPDKLVELGVGKMPNGPGYEQPVAESAATKKKLTNML